MDNIDYRILKILQKNARETASSIGKQIHLSVSAVIERIRKLEENGTIRSYTIIVDEKRTGNQMTALMEVRIENEALDSFSEMIREMDSVVACYYKTGDSDLLLKIVCASSDELEQIHRSIIRSEGVKETRTQIVLGEIKNMHSSIRRPDQNEGALS